MSISKNNKDPRVIRTIQLLRASLISLIPAKGYESITIQDITDRATLNRATFYLHYKDKNELLMDTFYELISNATPQPPETGDSAVQKGFDSIKLIFDQFAQHAEFFRVLLNEECPPIFNKLLREYIMKICLDWFSALQPDDEKVMVSTEVASYYLGAAFMGVIGWWLQNRMPFTSDEMASQLIKLTSLGINQTLGLSIELE